MGNDLFYFSAGKIASLIRRKELSPVEVVDAFIDRIDERNPSLNAFVYKGFSDARREAISAEQAVSRGKDLGVLHGVPVALKDLFDFKPGWVSTLGGIRALKDNIANHYCGFAERIEPAGAIILGKTNSPTMGFRGTCDNFLFGPSRNPFNTDKNSGGSSGGSAAAVADGMLPLAEGTDGGGAIRIPSAWCGVYGYKAAFGRIPFIIRPNAFGGTAPFVFEGTITRTVDDAALALNVLSGYDARDPYSIDEKWDFTRELDRSIDGWKIAYSPNFDVFPMDKEIEAIVASAVQSFEEAGARVEEVKLDIHHSQKELSDLWCRLIMPMNVATFESFKRSGIDLLKDHREDFPPEYLRWIDKGYTMTTKDFFGDQEIRSEIYDAIQSILGEYQILITPTVASMPVDNMSNGNTVGPKEIAGEAVDPLIGWCLTYFLNFTGHPAASIPAGMSADQLPVGMQIIGRRYADQDVLTASRVFESLRPWASNYKLCANRNL